MSITWTFRYRGDFAEISMEILIDFDMKTEKKNTSIFTFQIVGK
jgi:hypothetical protein